jgi:hypothetical protein
MSQERWVVADMNNPVGFLFEKSPKQGPHIGKILSDLF